MNDVRENVRRFNEEEAVWQRYEEKKRTRRLPLRLSRIAKKLFDQLDWIAAKRETRGSDCVGKQML